MTSNTVTIYHDYDYGGASQELPVGAYTHATPGLANAISAVKIPEGMVVTLWSNHDFTGEKRILRKDTPRLTDFNDKAQSLLVALDQPAFASSLHFAGAGRKICFAKKDFPLQYHEVITGQRMQHLQDMLRLPDADGKQYYMGTFSQNCTDDEGGMVFVGEVSAGNAQIIWCDEFTNKHEAGGYNHPGDLRRLGNVVVIAGQNWDSDWSWAGRKAFNRGKDNPQYVLFYDVSSPANPKYMGRMNSCEDAYGLSKTLSGEIDEVSVEKLGDYYYLSFGRKDTGLVCWAEELRPNAPWEYERDAGIKGAPPVTFMLNDEMVVGEAQLDEDDSTKVIFKKLSLPSLSGTHIMTSFIPEHPFGGGATFNLSALGNGETSVVIANVESDSTIDIFEVSGAYGPITALYLLFNNGKLPAGYVKILVDLNRNADGDDIYLCYTRDPSKGLPITGIRIDLEDKKQTSAPSGYRTIDNSEGYVMPDLNRKAGGKYVYMYYRTDEAAGTPIRNIAILVGENARADPGWEFITNDLNKGAGGDDLYLQFTRL